MAYISINEVNLNILFFKFENNNQILHLIQNIYLIRTDHDSSIKIKNQISKVMIHEPLIWVLFLYVLAFIPCWNISYIFSSFFMGKEKYWRLGFVVSIYVHLEFECRYLGQDISQRISVFWCLSLRHRYSTCSCHLKESCNVWN